MKPLYPCRISFFYLVTLLLSVSMHFSYVSANDCYAVLKIRASETRPNHYALDGCIENPDDDIHLTDYQSRIPVDQVFSTLIKQCNACCQARAPLCTGYLTGNWIDTYGASKPQRLLTSLQVEWQDLAGQGAENEPDCICLEKKDVNDDINRKYEELATKLDDFRYRTHFFAMKDIVDHWTSFTSHFSFYQ